MSIRSAFYISLRVLNDSSMLSFIEGEIANVIQCEIYLSEVSAFNGKEIAHF